MSLVLNLPERAFIYVHRFLRRCQPSSSINCSGCSLRNKRPSIPRRPPESHHHYCSTHCTLTFASGYLNANLVLVVQLPTFPPIPTYIRVCDEIEIRREANLFHRCSVVPRLRAQSRLLSFSLLLSHLIFFPREDQKLSTFISEICSSLRFIYKACYYITV